MTTVRPELYLFVLAALALAGCVLLLALGQSVPEFLQTVVVATVVGGAGVSTPRSITTAPATTAAAGTSA